MKNIFRDIFKGKVVIAGVGNVLRGDDALGPLLIEKLKGKTDCVCIDAGSAPENYLGKIAKQNPKTILIIDAIALDKSPGEYAILNKEDILNSGFTTHDLSPRMFIDFLEKETDAEIYLLGIQPQNISFGAPVSRKVKNTLGEISELIELASKNKLCTKHI